LVRLLSNRKGGRSKSAARGSGTPGPYPSEGGDREDEPLRHDEKKNVSLTYGENGKKKKVYPKKSKSQMQKRGVFL